MTKVLGRWCCAVAVALLVAAGARGNTVSMTLTDSGNNTLGGVFVNPYTATIGGVSTQVICDDFHDDAYVGETWTANVTTFANLATANPPVLWGDNLLLYEQGAWLSLQLLAAANANQTTQAADISFALWALLDPGDNPLGRLSGTDLSNAQTLLSQAQALTQSSFTSSQLAQFANFVIYTPTQPGQAGYVTPTCSGGPCAHVPPQEFLALNGAVPEPTTGMLLTIDMLALMLAGAVLVRRKAAGTAN